MCGIFGYNSPLNQTRNHDFFSALSHRGPDASAVTQVDSWTLGHLRLSIIETSDASNQPFEKDGSWLIYNGEIYNYLELRAKYLANVPLRTESDTEVLITLLNLHGLKILNELNGMFAFAWYDSKQRLLQLVRDRFGVKPLYYSEHKGHFYFSSEIKPLASLHTSATLDTNIIDSFFSDTATDFDQRSGIEQVLQIKAGHHLSISVSGQKHITRWYHGHDHKVDHRIFSDKEKTITAFEALLTDALMLRHRADVPICLTLSGGLDSTTLYVLAKEKLDSKIQPFVFAHPGSPTDESPRAIALAKKYGDTPIVVASAQNGTIPALEEALQYLEYPIWNPSAVAYLDMYKAIKAHGYTVVIEGHGSDEQLGGYPYMLEAAWKEMLLKGRFRFAYTLYVTWQATQNPGLGQQVTASTKAGTLLNMAKGLLRGLIKTLLAPHKWKYLSFGALVRESFDYKILPIVLRAFDRLPMAASLEARCPFMDYRVVEFLRVLPLEYKVNEIGSKAILREILKKYGHAEIYQNRAKMGFASDIPALLNNPESKAYLAKAVADFDYPKYQAIKQRAEQRLQKKVLDWDDVTDIWKVASIAMTKRLYENK